MKPQPIPSGSQRVLQAAPCETERAPGCSDTRCGSNCPQEMVPSNLKSSGLGGKRRRDAYGSGRAGAEQRWLSRLGLSTGGGVVCCIAAVPGRNFG